MKRALFLSLFLFSSGLVACDAGAEDEPPVDEELTGDEWAEILPTAEGPGAGTDGFDYAFATRPAGESRAGRQPESARRIYGEEARCRPNDWVLENDHVRACVAGPVTTDALRTTGGMLIDLVPQSNPDFDEFAHFSTAVGLREASAEEVELVSDGSDGGAAVVRATGVDLPLALMVGSLGSSVATLLAKPSNVVVETEFRLAPDARYVEMITWISPDDRPSASFTAGTLGLFGDLVQAWHQGEGIGSPAPRSDANFVALFGSQHSWAYYGADARPSNLPIDTLADGLFLDQAMAGSVGTRGPAAFRRYLAVVEQGGTPALMDALSDVMPSATAQGIEQGFSAATSPGWTNPIWSIERVDGDAQHAVAALRFASSTEVQTLTLPQGDYVAVPVRWPSRHVEPFAFTVGDGAAVTLPAPGFQLLTIPEVHGGDWGMIPAKVRITQTDGDFRREDYFVAVRPLEVPLPPGLYDLEFSRGDDMNFVEIHNVDLRSADVTIPRVTLDWTLDRQYWISGDFHQHGMRSLDAGARSLTRVYTNLGAGLDVMGASDHDVVEDYATIAREDGVDQFVHVFQGTEISPVRGHINVFPTPYDWLLPGFGAPALVERNGRRELRQLSTKEILAAAVEQGVELIQLNHGRGSTLALMNWVKYDAATDEAQANPDDWPDHFDAMEIYNRASVFCVLFRDWQAMLLHGKRIAGLGNSDTHELDEPVGYPRNWLYIGPGVEALTDDIIIDAIKGMRSSTSAGVFIRWEDHLPGDIVATSAGVHELAVTVDVPSWSSVEQLQIVVNGIPEELITVDQDAFVDGRIRVPFEVELDGDSTVTVVGWSSRTMTHVLPGRRSWGFVNPLFMDVDGDGWTAPGAAAAALVPVLPGPPFCSSDAELDYDPHDHSHSHGSDGVEVHTHGHGFSHSHSHGHGHSHSHGHSHGHSHSHGHGHSHGHTHSHD